MSHFSVAFSAILDRLKASEGLTRNGFALRIDMPVQTLLNYLNEDRLPDATQLRRILVGLNRDDARTLILARVRDDVPAPWCDELLVIDRAAHNGEAEMPGHAAKLPAKFLQHLDLLRVEGERNHALIDLVKDLVELLGLEAPCKPPRAKAKRKSPGISLPVSGPQIPARVVVSTNPALSTTPPSPHALNETPTKKAGRVPLSKASGSRAALRAMAKRESGDKNNSSSAC